LKACGFKLDTVDGCEASCVGTEHVEVVADGGKRCDLSLVDGGGSVSFLNESTSDQVGIIDKSQDSQGYVSRYVLSIPSGGVGEWVVDSFVDKGANVKFELVYSLDDTHAIGFGVDDGAYKSGAPLPGSLYEQSGNVDVGGGLGLNVKGGGAVENRFLGSFEVVDVKDDVLLTLTLKKGSADGVLVLNGEVVLTFQGRMDKDVVYKFSKNELIAFFESGTDLPGIEKDGGEDDGCGCSVVGENEKGKESPWGKMLLALGIAGLAKRRRSGKDGMNERSK
jgi:hypothetical protein